MSLARMAKRRDRNERAIIAALVKAGCRVMQSDIVDLIVQRGGRGWTALLECKQEHGALTPRQEALMENGWVIHIVRTPEDALRAVGLGR